MNKPKLSKQLLKFLAATYFFGIWKDRKEKTRVLAKNLKKVAWRR